jgi:hypothetical protein
VNFSSHYNISSTIVQTGIFTEMNHSPKFWAIVKNMLPDYAIRKAKLKALQKRLATEDWG